MDAVPPKKMGVPKFVKYFTAAVAFAIAAIFVLCLVRYYTPPRIVVEADAGFKKAKLTINPEQLRQWALESIKRWPSTNGMQTIPTSEIPQYIQNLYSYPPEGAFVEGNEVDILWGGGFFGWFFSVSQTNSTLPHDTGNEENPHTYKWVDGIYYSRDGKWKLQ